ncbi:MULTISPECIES: TlpA family protein disulfide reductase [Bacteroidota]|uniref:TlpA family protein disulfide reductase n=1 Tax=Bacteroidota TaxID=976 RepID=UPI001CBC9761|nr:MULTISPECIES: TlpA disulfide reductase family protein [Bacteroidota]MBZ4190751.1 TlpA family protein disulfide reductase [Niabella beijingensis]UMQ40857.1 TlpA family protein disulfide reductase [Chryseobacterium sp. Y16C]
MANKPIRNRIISFIACQCPILVTGGRCFIILFCFIGLVAGQRVLAQTPAPASLSQQSKALAIGDQIPDALWNAPLQVVNHPQGKQTVTLADYKGKLIILDFWSTWCGTCVAALPRLHQLEKEIKKDAVILPITDQKTKDILGFLKRNSILSSLNLFSVVEDTVYKSIFPYTMLPHEVWIDQSGKVYAFTYSSDVTKENITLALAGQQSTIKQKQDNLTYDRTQPLLLNNNGANESFFLNRSIITTSIDGISSNVTKPRVNEADSTFRTIATNATIQTIYSLAFKALDTLPNNRVKLETQEAPYIAEKRFLHDLYCYEWIAPLSALKYASQKIQADLNFYFGINGRMEKRNTKCHAIKIIGKTTLVSDKPENGLQYLSAWVNKTNRDIHQPPFINDFAGQKIAIPNIPPNTNDIKSINEKLKPFGVAVVEDERLLDLFVISEL